MNRWVERYIGIPWKTGGRTALLGLDCWGLLRHVYSVEFGIELSAHAASPGHLASPSQVVSEELTGATWTPVDDPVDGDAVALGRTGGIDHVGVYIRLSEEDCMIHASQRQLSTIIPITRLRELGWDTVRFYRHVDRLTDHQSI